MTNRKRRPGPDEHYGEVEREQPRQEALLAQVPPQAREGRDSQKEHERPEPGSKRGEPRYEDRPRKDRAVRRADQVERQIRRSTGKLM